jgi:hypothetical protein
MAKHIIAETRETIRRASRLFAASVRVRHCTDCQSLSGSAFRTNVPVVQADMPAIATAVHFHFTLRREPRH